MSYIPSNRNMYMPASGSPPITPPYTIYSGLGAWTDNGSADQIGSVFDAPSSTSFTSKTLSLPSNGSTAYRAYLMRQYISPALPTSWEYNPDTGTGTTLLSPIYIRMKYDGTNAPGGLVYPTFLLWVAKPDTSARTINRHPNWGSGLALTSTLKAMAPSSTSIASSAAAITAGDYLVFEIGVSAHATTHSTTITMEFGDASANNLTNGQTTQANPWGMWTTYIIGVLGGGNKTTWTKPRRPTHAANRWQSPPVPDRSSDILNEFILRPSYEQLSHYR